MWQVQEAVQVVGLFRSSQADTMCDSPTAPSAAAVPGPRAVTPFQADPECCPHSICIHHKPDRRALSERSQRHHVHYQHSGANLASSSVPHQKSEPAKSSANISSGHCTSFAHISVVTEHGVHGRLDDVVQSGYCWFGGSYHPDGDRHCPRPDRKQLQ
jgi:hypothetical protein